MLQDKITGCLFGMALGDALGAETEFLNVVGILQRFPPDGPKEPPYPALVTDDTQMALAVGEALVAAPRPFAPDTLGDTLKTAFIDWYNDPENNRAPGNTCLSACEELIDGKPWHEASQISSKGCGANMRVMPVGLLQVSQTERAAIAQFQAAYTHGHPTGLAAADLTAFVVAELLHGTKPEDLPRLVREYALSQREVYHRDWLGELWYRSVVFRRPEDYIAHGWDECLKVIDRLDTALVNIDRNADPCLATGAGWIAEEAFATALLCFLMYPDDPEKVMRRAAVSSGDSDSIACIAGAFAGVYHGYHELPKEWRKRIEYAERLKKLSMDMFMMIPPEHKYKPHTPEEDKRFRVLMRELNERLDRQPVRDRQDAVLGPSPRRPAEEVEAEFQAYLKDFNTKFEQRKKFLLESPSIESLVERLATTTTLPDARNEYAGDDDNSRIRRDNLLRYLTTMQQRQPDILLVMEAPGYRGCRLTGVPVTSRKILMEGVPELAMFGTAQGYQNSTDAGFEAVYGEQSASIVWQTLAALQTVPLIWNTFPFHPHQPGKPLTNRAPRRGEIEQGSVFLRSVLAIFQPKTVIAVGNVAYTALTGLEVACNKIRHPAQGGKNDFVAGLTKAVSRTYP